MKTVSQADLGMQNLKMQLRPWICAGLTGSFTGIILLGFATGFQWDDQCTTESWRAFIWLAAVLMLPCVANSLLGVCVTRKLVRREALLLIPLLWFVPAFFEVFFFGFGIFLLPAVVVWACGLSGISVATKCDAEISKHPDEFLSVTSE